MRIIELELHKYIRLAFAAIETITYRPEMDCQIIIGTNGSGKSSLMSELNPLPPSKAYMLPGGYKRVVIEHRGKTYTLLSTYGKGGKNSFIEHCPDGQDIELNDGGTIVAQKILIEKIFGLTIDLLKLWLGKTAFTSLPPLKRRDWILKISGNDLDFAMEAYNIVKSMNNDNKAVCKHLINRLGEETADIADQDRIEELENQLVTLTKHINGLLEQKDNSLPSIKSIHVDLDRLVREFEDCSNEALTLRLVKPNYVAPETNNVYSLKEEWSNRQQEIKLAKERLEELYAQKDHINETVKTLASNGVTTANELKVATESLIAEIELVKADTPIYDELKGQSIEQHLGRFAAVKPTLLDLLSTTQHNVNGYFTIEKLANTKLFAEKCQNYISAAEQRVALLEHQLNHHKGLDSVECPECNHVFVPDVNNVNPADWEKEILELNTKRADKEIKLKKSTEYIEECGAYFGQIDLIKRIINENPELDLLWTALVKDGLYREHPMKHTALIYDYHKQLDNCLVIEEIQKRVELNNTILKTMESSNKDQENYSGDHVKYIDDFIAKTISKIQRLEVEVDGIRRYHQDVTKATKAIARAQEIRDIIAEKHDLLVRAGINKVVNEQIQSNQVALGMASSALSRINKHDAVIKDLQKQELEASERLLDTQIVMKALSPVDGLISKYIQGFLDVFIADTNDVIADIWTTNLEILTCGVDSTDVTCKFPLSVNHGFLVTPDIAEGSDGQVDVINFSFRMVFAQYLGLYDYPLFLDELAPTLDEKHRENIIRYINSLMENNHFEQMFMISHYAANHYAFANSEILMLDGRNIVNKPISFNSHVKIVYSDELKEMVDQFKQAA